MTCLYTVDGESGARKLQPKASSSSSGTLHLLECPTLNCYFQEDAIAQTQPLSVQDLLQQVV